MNLKEPLIFVVEDDPALNKLFTTFIKSKIHCKIEGFLTGEECIENLDKKPDIILQDYDLPGMNGGEVLEKTKAINPEIEFIFLSGQESIQVAVDILKKGAFDYLIKDGYAKENAVYRIKKLLYVKKLEFNNKSYKMAVYIFGASLLVTWVFFFIMKRLGIFM